MTPARTLAALGLVALLLAADPKEKAPTFSKEQLTFFEKEVQPILKDHCLKCHSGKKSRGGLKLDSRAAVLQGGDLGPAVILEKLADSPLLKAVHWRDKLEMPPAGKLPKEKIAVLERWVREGLPYTAGKEAVAKDAGHEKVTIGDAERNWWAYRPRTTPSVPTLKNAGWARTPLDAFILAKLEAKGIAPNAPADRVALARRLYYDLTGLPPTPAEVDGFVADSRPDAYERLVDTLLSSPAYGEKWGRHWLDLVRFAETNGYERDGIKPFAWRFRDYVVRSFNADKPYDRFVTEQLAGDELPGGDPDPIIATGFYRLGLWDDEPVDPKQARADEVDDWVSTTGQVFLAMTLNCARCHDHKKDPIPQADYYRLVAFFEDVKHFSNSRDPHSRTNLTDISPPEVRSRYEETLRRDEIRKAELTAVMEKIENEVIKRMPAEDQRAAEGVDRPQVVTKLGPFFKGDEKKEYARLKAEVAKLGRLAPRGQELALSVHNCYVRPPATHVMVRGNPHALGAKVEPGFPAVLNYPDPKIPTPPKGAKTSGRRSALAEWVTRKDNPMTARVLANRLWQFHFGRGIVPSSSDFGKLGDLPTHPELLDYLANEVVAGDWALKRVHRLILTSSVYRQSSVASRDGLAKDPANTLLWRYPMRRLAAEEVRDSILAVSGSLNRRMAGPSVYPTIPRDVLAGQSVPGSGWGKSPPEERDRRSVYVHVKRSLIVPILQTHDQADTDSSCPVRYTTTVPTQALGMLNGEFTNAQARAFAERLQGDLAAQVTEAVRLTTGRVPTADEVARDVAFVRSLKKPDPLDGLTMFCLLALNSNEFLYLD